MIHESTFLLLVAGAIVAGMAIGTAWYGMLVRRRRRMRPILRRLAHLQATMAPWPSRTEGPRR